MKRSILSEQENLQLRVKQIIFSPVFLALLLFIIAFLPRVIGLSKAEVFTDEMVWMQRGTLLEEGIKERDINRLSTGWWPSNEIIGIGIPTAVSVVITNIISGQDIYHITDIDSFIFITRLIPVILASMFVPLIFLILFREGILDKSLAFFFAATLALAPNFTAYSRWIHMDTYLTLFCFLALYSFYLWIRKQKKFYLFLTVFFTSLAYVTKLPALLLMVFFAVVLLIFFLQDITQSSKNGFIKELKAILEKLTIRKPVDLNTKKIVISGFILFVLFFAFNFIFWPRAWRYPFQLLTYLVNMVETSASTPHEQPSYFLGKRTHNIPIYYYLVIMALKLPWPILLGLGLFILTLFRRVRRKSLHLFVIVTILFSLLFLIAMSCASKKGGIRYLLPVLPFLYLYGFLGLHFLFKRHIRVIFGVLLVYQVSFLTFYYPEYYHYYSLFFIGNGIDKFIMNDFGAGRTDALQYALEKYGNRPIVYGYPIFSEYYGPKGRPEPYFSFQPIEEAKLITQQIYGEMKPTVIVFQKNVLLRTSEDNKKRLKRDFKKVYEVKYGNYTTATVWEEKRNSFHKK